MSERYPGGFITKSPPALNPALGNAAPGIWTLDQAMQAVKNGTWPAYDPYFEYTTLLLHGNGTNGAQNNTFLDASTNNFTITRNGNATQGTFSPYGSNWSNYFNGGYVSLTNSTGLGSNNFTIEFWGLDISGSSNWGLFSIGATSGTDFAGVTMASSGGIYISTTGSSWQYSNIGSLTFSTDGQWHHYAIVRNGGSLLTFKDGVLIATNAISGTIVNKSGTWLVGIKSDQAGTTTGYISNFRVVNGTAVYTATFTPPTAPLTAITNTAVLTCQSNRFIDNSSNNFTLTVNGSPSVQRFSPFSPATAYSAATVGGSGYFDGTGDYLNGPNTGQFAPTGDFTISMWFYPTSFAASYYVLAGSWNTGTSDEWLIQYDNTGAIRFLTTTDSTFSAAGVVKLNQWQFLTVSRSGNTVTGYINGTSFRSYTLTGTVGSATKTVYVGIQAGTTWPYVGWISDYRLVSGSAQSETPPTSPATAISGTNTLLSFTNGGIIDNAMMNDLETVGNAQISTSVKKYGTGSLYFDGSGDYLQINSTPSNQLGAGDFTVEGWFYANSPVPQYGYRLYTHAWSGTNFFLITAGEADGANTNVVSVIINNGSAISSTATFTTGTWNHFAVVRSSGTVKVYLNGSGGSGSSNTTDLSNLSYPIGIGSYTHSSGQALNGYIDDLRITKGYARYTANFTPPTSQLQDQ